MEGMSGRLEFDEDGYRTGFILDVFHLSYRSPLKKASGHY